MNSTPLGQTVAPGAVEQVITLETVLYTRAPEVLIQQVKEIMAEMAMLMLAVTVEEEAVVELDKREATLPGAGLVMVEMENNLALLA